MPCLDTGGASRQAERGQSGFEVGFAKIVKPYDEEEDGDAEKAGGDFAAFLGLVVPVHNCPAVKIGENVSGMMVSGRNIIVFSAIKTGGAGFSPR